jgi:restriction endonuclease Mrr
MHQETDRIIRIRTVIEWAITYLVQAGLLERPRRGHYQMTTHGLDVLKKDKDKLDLAYLKKIPAFIDFFHRTSTDTTSDKNALEIRWQQRWSSREDKRVVGSRGAGGPSFSGCDQ